MTPGQRKWLEKLRDAGPLKRPRYGAHPMAFCIRAGWSRWGSEDGMEHITDKGHEALREIVMQELADQAQELGAGYN